MIRWAFLSSLLFLVPPAVSAASPIADLICDQQQQLKTRMITQMRSEKIGAGLRDPETIMEIWTDEDGSWLLVMSRSNGISCIVAMGEHWQARPQS